MAKFKVGDIVERIDGDHMGMQVGHRATVTTLIGDDVNLKEYTGGHAKYNLKVVESITLKQLPIFN